MNRKFLKGLIVKATILAMTANIFLTDVNGFKTKVANAQVQVSENVTKLENTTLIKNEDMSLVKKETNTPFNSWWQDSNRPDGWEIRQWSGAAATKNNTPAAKLVKDSKVEGGQYVEVAFNNTVGFFQMDSSNVLSVSEGKDYSFSARLKTEALTTSEPLYIRTEQYDGANKLINGTRKDMFTINGTNDWKNYDFTLKAATGAKSIKIILVWGRVSADSKGATGKVYVDSISAKEKVEDITAIELNQKDFTVKTGYEGSLTYSVQPQNAAGAEVIWESSNSNVVRVDNGVIKAIANGQAIITVKSAKNPNIVSTVKVMVTDGEIKIEKVEFSNNEVRLKQGKSFIVNLKALPEQATEKYVLVSEDDKKAKIKDGIVTGVAKGQTNIIAKSNDGRVLGKLKVIVDEYVRDEYEKTLDKFAETLVPNSVVDLNDDQMVNCINTMVDNAENLWKTMDKSQDRKGLWKDTTDFTKSDQVTKQFNNLFEMSKAFYMNGSRLQGNPELLKDIIDGLNWLTDNRYKVGIFYGNWWDFEIGSSQKLHSSLVLIKDYLNDDQIKKFTDIIDWYVKDTKNHTQGKYPALGANRSDLCKVSIINNLFTKKSDKIQSAVNDLGILFNYVTRGDVDHNDGFYKDGSFIEHVYIPYTGTYGSVLLAGIGELSYILSDSNWKIADENMQFMYDIILNSYDPVIYKGVVMNGVSGRAISRANERDYGHGFGVMRRILNYYAESAPKDYSDKFKAMVKQWILSNDERDFISTSTDVQFIGNAKKLLKDSSIAPRGELIGNYVFANMDRVVHRRGDYMLALSMYSDRIANYSMINGENLKGYHTSDGMTYLYNGDISQYSKGFWPTVDVKRLPGTTVDTKALVNGAGHTALSKQNWVGGASIGDYGVAGMFLDKSPKDPSKDVNMDLKAKKSWFMFDDEIVALGADITSTKDKSVETIVENRIIDKAKDKLYADDKDITAGLSANVVNKDSQWLYLEGNKKDSSIGYYFPNKVNINLKKEDRTGSWKDINSAQPDIKESNTFFTAWVDHGTNPKGSTYEYVLLPNKSKDGVKAYSSNPDIKIIANNGDVQAVKESKNNIIGVNLWNDKAFEVEGFKLNNKGAYMFKETNGVLEIGVSDPTMANDGVIVIEIAKTITSIVSTDEGVEVVKENGKTLVKVNVKDAKGKTFKAKLK